MSKTEQVVCDYLKEPGGIVTPTEFSFTVPKPPKFYTFATSIDIAAPSGYVVRVEPHPRFYTDSDHANMGETLRRMGRLSEAEAAFRAAVRLSPNDPRLLATLGYLLAQQNRTDEARQYL